jgi:hypothetical protein
MHPVPQQTSLNEQGATHFVEVGRKANKSRFSYAQRYALWRAYDMKFFYCEKPLDFRNMTTDHVLPEHLVNDPTEFQRIKADSARCSINKKSPHQSQLVGAPPHQRSFRHPYRAG